MMVELRTYSTSTSQTSTHFIKVGFLFPKYYTPYSLFWEKDENGDKYYEWFQVDKINFEREIRHSIKQEVIPDWFKNAKHKGFSEEIEKEIMKIIKDEK
jgi:hypothetical protein